MEVVEPKTQDKIRLDMSISEGQLRLRDLETKLERPGKAETLRNV